MTSRTGILEEAQPVEEVLAVPHGRRVHVDATSWLVGQVATQSDTGARMDLHLWLWSRVRKDNEIGITVLEIEDWYQDLHLFSAKGTFINMAQEAMMKSITLIIQFLDVMMPFYVPEHSYV